MKKFIKELRRREVFRTAGLYVGICWILIEVSSVMLPAFDAPEWLFRGAIIAAVAGFPVMLVLAWFFDVNEQGISLQADPTETVAGQLGARKSDFAIIGVLLLALVVSLFLNLSTDTSEPVELDSVSVLVADFETSEDDAVFDGVLQHALVVGLEVSPHITAFERHRALDSAGQSEPAARLSAERAREVAERQGVQLLLAGTLQESGSGYRLTVDAIDVADGNSLFTISEQATSRDSLLQAIGELSAKVREELGDRASGEQQFTSASLKAAQAYVSARRFEMAGELVEAATDYERASVADPGSGRAFAHLALTEFALGRTESAATHWAMALSLLDTMTERERLRVLGRYAAEVDADDAAAANLYADFVEKFPADVGARSGYAAALFRQLDFAASVAETEKILQVFPFDRRHRTQLALYAMYAGEWDAALEVAEQVIAAYPDAGAAHLPVAMAALAQGDLEASRDAYERMALSTDTAYGASVAELGLADIDLYVGDIATAQERLRDSIQTDLAEEEPRMAALKYVALAQSLAEQEDFPAAETAATNALSFDDSNAVSVSAAMVYIQAGELTLASQIADALAERADTHSRAYAQMLKGMILEREGEQTAAILSMRRAIAMADLWLIRYQSGKAYLRAGNAIEALGELTRLPVRQGEATSVFLDDMPTYRVLAELPYWTGRVEEALKMRSAAKASYEKFIALRPQGGSLAADALQRAAALE